MKMLLLCVSLLLGLFISLAEAATVYIDNDCVNNGDGTLSTPCAGSGGAPGPRNTLVGVTWTAGNVYSGKGGAVQNLTSFLLAGSGTAGNPITITSHGTGRWILNGQGSYAIATINRSYITFDNVEVRSDAQHGIYHSINASASDLIITNCRFTSVSGNAIQIGDTAVGTDIDNVTITNNTFENIGNAGITYDPIDATSVQNFNNHTITGNTFTAIGTTSTNSAIDIVMNNGTSATMTNLTISNNTISNTNLADTSPRYAIRVQNSATPSAIAARYSNVVIQNNTITTTRNGGITAHLVGPPAIISGNTITGNPTNAAIALFYSSGVVIEDNTISGITPLPESGNIDGMGLDLEYNSGTVVRTNSISNNLGYPSISNSGQGIYDVGGSGDVLTGNLLVGNKVGIQADGGGLGVANTWANNTIVGSTQDGIWTSTSVTKVDHFLNNIVSGSGRYGIYDNGVSDQTLTKNIVFGSGTANYFSITQGASDLVTDPLFLNVSANNYRTLGTSPARRAGARGYACIDVRGRPCWLPPDIGAYQATSGDPAVTRTAR